MRRVSPIRRTCAGYFELLSPSPIDTDDLVRESGIEAATLSALLLELALAGRITRHANGSVSLA